MKVVGTCSLCGGDVCVPTLWQGIYTPKPQRVRCHAVAVSGPVIPMRPVKAPVGSCWQ